MNIDRASFCREMNMKGGLLHLFLPPTEHISTQHAHRECSSSDDKVANTLSFTFQDSCTID